MVAKKDYFDRPVRKLVMLGESNAFGMCASDPRNEWAQTVANLIRDFQDEALTFINNAIPANVIGPKSPGYKSLPDYALPTAVERYEKDIIDHDPDMTIIAYGLNDSRCGNPVGVFIKDLETIVSGVKDKTRSLVVLTSPYWNTQYNKELWDNLENKPEWVDGRYKVFSRPGRDLVWAYVEEIEKLALKYDCLFVDLFTPTEDCLWLLNRDHDHFNDIGQKVIGQLVFNKIACSCSFIGSKSKRIEIEGNFDITNTGGTGCQTRSIKGFLGR